MTKYKAADLFNLEGQTAVITGASRGLGMHLAKVLAANGANLGICAREEHALQEVARGIEKEYGVKTLAIKADVTDAAQVKQFMGAVHNHFHSIDILVNNAGIAGSSLVAESNGNIENPKDPDAIVERAVNVLYTNLKSTTLATEEAVEYMKQNNYGRIVNIASTYGMLNHKEVTKDAWKVIAGEKGDFPVEILTSLGFQAYRASKTAQIIQTLRDANEYGKYGITVNAMALSYIELGKDIKNRDLIDYWKNLQVIKSSLEPDSITPAFLSLVSPLVQHTTGSIVQVDGGWHLKRFINDLLVKDLEEYTERMAKAFRTVCSKWNPLRSVLKS